MRMTCSRIPGTMKVHDALPYLVMYSKGHVVLYLFSYLLMSACTTDSLALCTCEECRQASAEFGLNEGEDLSLLIPVSSGPGLTPVSPGPEYLPMLGHFIKPLISVIRSKCTCRREGLRSQGAP